MSSPSNRSAAVAAALLLAACGGSSTDTPAGQQCTVPADCGADAPCRLWTCDAGACGTSDLPAGTVVASQTPGDCQENRCDGNGGVTSVAKDTDVPADDGNACTGETCVSGAPSHPALQPDTSCAQDGGTVCDGLGACVACNDASQCPGSDTECQTRTCTSHVCGVSNALPGTVVSSQTAGDCQENQCDGDGGVTSAAKDSDVPADDGNQCTSEICTGSTPSHPNVPSGTACNQNGGTKCDASGSCVECLEAADCGTSTACRTITCDTGTCGHTDAQSDTPCTDGGGTVCDGGGACVACNTAAQCPGSDTECATRTCTGHTCGFSYAGIGTAVSSQTSGDCHEQQCDGDGNVVSVVEDADVPVDGNVCTQDVCTSGTPSNPSLPDGVGCPGNGTCQSGVCVMPYTAVNSVSPAVGGSAAAPTSISVTFNVPMDPATLTAQTEAGACTGSIQVSNDDFASCVAMASAAAAMSGANAVATVTPAPGLLVNRTYRIRVTTAAAGAINGPLPATFTTAAGFLTTSSCTLQQVVISQVYGGGGDVGATFQNDFVELHNRGATAVDVGGWSIQYAPATGSSWGLNLVQIPAATVIPAGGYFLVQLASAGANGSALPAPDLVGVPSINMSATAGKVALASDATALTGFCPRAGAVVDVVTWGAVNGCATSAPALSNTMAAVRGAAGCAATGSISADFAAATPVPRSSATAPVACGCGAVNESGLAVEADYCVVQFPQSLNVATGAPISVWGQIYEATVTEAPGAAAGVIAQLGYGPPSANPETDPGWTWTLASFSSQQGNNDEYFGILTAPAAGSYLYAYRFSLDGGVTFTYCDANRGDFGAGSNPGLTLELGDLPVMNVTP